jgi:hypothetical protein
LKNSIAKYNTQVDKYFTREGQLVDTFEALRENLPGKLFDSVRQILYGPLTPEVPLKTETVERAK